MKFYNTTLKLNGKILHIWDEVKTTEKSIAKNHKKILQKRYPYFYFTLRKIKPSLFGIYMSKKKRSKYLKRPKSI